MQMDPLSSPNQNGVHGDWNSDHTHTQPISNEDRNLILSMRDMIEREVPNSQLVDDSTLRRFLYARESNVQKASELYLKYRKWRETFVPLGYISETMISNELKKNLICMQGFDKKGRPIAVVKFARHKPCHKKLDDLKRFLVYSFDKMSSSTQGGHESFSIIADLDGWTFRHVDIRGGLAAVEILQIVMIDNKDIKTTLLNDIDESQLPEIYGGKLPLVPVHDAVAPNRPPN
ncbi:uncharacterized protein LOC131075964 isoform X2 [Cryptomeria japonica]|uniref:uncharacterized protein LOC131075964 isoform X2 n=1 Tax=Cryptomeria japonica TaxID=3369 RepID=UPI0025AB9003|nr:uncharacterized protein LOC131075964 isoform X2 [Cryptomeria japonica]